MLRNKKILIISPNYWGKMMVSKHHYALELTKRGNTVYFLNPPDLNKSYFELNNVAENLQVISYKPLFRGKKYLPGPVFNMMLYFQVRFLLKKIRNKIDIVWSFDSSIYLNLNWFKAKTKIYFIADKGEKKAMQKISWNANLVLSVSEQILSGLNLDVKKKHFIEHGVPDSFNDFNVKSGDYKEDIKVGYVGNIFKQSFDSETFKLIIEQNPRVNFNIFGALKISESNLSGFKSGKAFEFIEFCKNQSNVTIKGVVEPKLLSKEMEEFDAFVFIENPQKDVNNSANSHKLVQYLRSGKVVISNHVSSYVNKRELIEMVDEMHNDKLPALFKKVIGNLEYYNRAELQKMRIEYALDNTYRKQIERIELLINQQSGN
jgi:hypothetical protein